MLSVCAAALFVASASFAQASALFDMLFEYAMSDSANKFGVFLPSMRQLHETLVSDHGIMLRQKGKMAFDRWLCSLPVRVEKDFFRPAVPTVGKSILRFSEQLSKVALKFDQRIVQPVPEDWMWLPKQQDCPDSDTWIRADVCEMNVSTPERPENPVNFLPKSQEWLAAIWRAGQFVRMRRDALGPCGRAAVQALKPRRRAANQVSHGMPCWIVAVHIRRGDACKRFVGDDRYTDGRVCYPTRLYFRAIQLLRARYDVTRSHRWCIHVATDSPSVIDEFDAFDGSVDVVYVDFNRIDVGGAENLTLGLTPEQAETLHIENRDHVNRSLAFASLYADLELLSHAHFVVGTPTSAITRLILFAVIGRQGFIPPYVFISASEKDATVCHKDKWACRLNPTDPHRSGSHKPPWLHST